MLPVRVLFFWEKGPVAGGSFSCSLGLVKFSASAQVAVRTLSLASAHLGRQLQLTLLLPPGYDTDTARSYPLLLLNDGQDFERLLLAQTLDSLYAAGALPPVVVVGIHANEDRLHEYGTAHSPDYKGRGSRAARHRDFVLGELLPFLDSSFRLLEAPAERVVAGFSLGGLSAFDLAYAHPEVFGAVGVFSGSFWWRSRAFEDGYDDHNDRILHLHVRNTPRPTLPLRFWFEAGTLDERSDRNQNGVIDAIDDTLDLMQELRQKGYTAPAELTYVQVEGGRHDPQTWGQAMPAFLRWAFLKKP